MTDGASAADFISGSFLAKRVRGLGMTRAGLGAFTLKKFNDGQIF